MKKILAGFIMDGYGGGIDKYLLNFLENVHTENIRIDFLTNEVSPELETFLQKYHSRIFAIPNLKHPVGQYREVCRILEAESYDIVYLNISTAIDCIAAWAAKKKKINGQMRSTERATPGVDDMAGHVSPHTTTRLVRRRHRRPAAATAVRCCPTRCNLPAGGGHDTRHPMHAQVSATVPRGSTDAP